jgi:hypothetical protein
MTVKELASEKLVEDLNTDTPVTLIAVERYLLTITRQRSNS